MPFQSASQARKCFSLASQGKAKGWDCQEWANKTDYDKLPEKAAALRKIAVAVFAKALDHRLRDRMIGFLDKAAEAGPPRENAPIYVIQAELGKGRRLGYALKVAYPHLTKQARELLTHMLIKSAVASCGGGGHYMMAPRTSVTMKVRKRTDKTAEAPSWDEYGSRTIKPDAPSSAAKVANGSTGIGWLLRRLGKQADERGSVFSPFGQEALNYATAPVSNIGGLIGGYQGRKRGKISEGRGRGQTVAGMMGLGIPLGILGGGGVGAGAGYLTEMLARRLAGIEGGGGGKGDSPPGAAGAMGGGILGAGLGGAAGGVGGYSLAHKWLGKPSWEKGEKEKPKEKEKSKEAVDTMTPEQQAALLEALRANQPSPLGRIGALGAASAGIGGLLGAAGGHARGNLPEGLGRGVIRGGATGLGALGGSLAGSAAQESLSASSPRLAALLPLLGALGGGGAGYGLSGLAIGKPESQRKKPMMI